MFTAGPGILNRVYNYNKYKYKLKSLPWKYFQPYGIVDDIKLKNLNAEIFAIHMSNGSWASNDTLFINILFKEWFIFLFIFLGMIIPMMVYRSIIKN